MDTKKKSLPQKTFSRFRPSSVSLPNLVEPQLKSYEWLITEGMKEVFDELSPVRDYGEKKFDLFIEKYTIGEPSFDEYYAKTHMRSYEAPIKATIRFKNKTLGTETSQEMFLADMPVMTPHGTFIINGIERVIVPQLTRSSGVFFTSQLIKGRTYFGAKIIPSRGVWIEIESEADKAIFVRIDRKRKIPITSLFRVLGAQNEEAMYTALKENEEAHEWLTATLKKDTVTNREEAFIELYRRLRDGDIATSDTARDFVKTVLSSQRYDISEVGRHRFNHRFLKDLSNEALGVRTLTLDDLYTIFMHIVHLNITPQSVADDIDHLGFRRVRFYGEMMQQKMRVGVLRMKRNIQDRMSTIEPETGSPMAIINARPLQATIREFFTTNQLSQFMQQHNLLTELEHMRILSALGPGGLTRERAGFEVRDVHPSHYGRVCPIHTPEGPNIGLILHMANFSIIDRFGFIQTPYVKVKDGTLTQEIVYFNALEEEMKKIAHAATPLNEKNTIIADKVEVRYKGEPRLVDKKDIEYMDVSTLQPFSVATSMIPFLEHNDANRALMGSNMQKQSPPSLIPEAPLVATGIEADAAKDTGRVVYALEAGTVEYSDAQKVLIKNKKGDIREHSLISFSRTNDMSCFHQRPIVQKGESVKKGQVIADASSTVNGQLSLGQNALVAFMSWSGANYEDAIIISERLVRNAKFSSIHMEQFECIVRDTKLGAEVTTHDIPNVGENRLKNLDEEGVIRIGAEVLPGDILVGKVTPKGESQLTPEERLLRSIFGEKAKDVKDTSLRVEGGKRGRIVGVKVFSRENGDSLDSGIIKRIHITLAQVRNVSVGDKLAGRHGNKGVISRILPEEDMPYLEDGTPVDVILTPLGVPSRMNLGQILEFHLGLAAHTLGYQAICPPFAGATEEEIIAELEKAGYPKDGKVLLRDGRTGDAYDQRIAIGYMYIMKLHHMVEDKIHMRSIGPYSLITQQPLGGKAQNGGQRFGEMEVWALLGYGAAYTLREVLTVKSDDIQGRSSAFDSIVRGNRIMYNNTPAAFNVLLHQLRALALDVRLEKEEAFLPTPSLPKESEENK
jgi:DNA-directed RNA polymerase subunit beta